MWGADREARCFTADYIRANWNDYGKVTQVSDVKCRTTDKHEVNTLKLYKTASNAPVLSPGPTSMI